MLHYNYLKVDGNVIEIFDGYFKTDNLEKISYNVNYETYEQITHVVNMTAEGEDKYGRFRDSEVIDVIESTYDITRDGKGKEIFKGIDKATGNTVRVTSDSDFSKHYDLKKVLNTKNHRILIKGRIGIYFYNPQLVFMGEQVIDFEETVNSFDDVNKLIEEKSRLVKDDIKLFFNKGLSKDITATVKESNVY